MINVSQIEIVLRLLVQYTKTGDSRYLKAIVQKQEKGLSFGSIIDNPLIRPYATDSLCRFEARPGQWISYDFQISADKNPCRQGKLALFRIEKAAGIKPTDLTSESVHFFRDAKYLEFPTMDQLLYGGFIAQGTYGWALKTAGMHPHAAKLEKKGLSERIVYFVTPKGNGLIYLTSVPEGISKKEFFRQYHTNPNLIRI